MKVKDIFSKNMVDIYTEYSSEIDNELDAHIVHNDITVTYISKDNIIDFTNGQLSMYCKNLFGNYKRNYIIFDETIFQRLNNDSIFCCEIVSVAERYDMKIIPISEKDLKNTLNYIFKKAEEDYEYNLVAKIAVKKQTPIQNFLTSYPSIGLTRAEQIIKDFQITGYKDLHRINLENFDKLKQLGKLKMVSKYTIEMLVKDRG